MRREILDDVLGAALDGGITHWCLNAAVVNTWPAGAQYASEAVSRGATLLLGVDGANPVTLDQHQLAKGIRLAARQAGMSLETFYDCHDAGMADNAVQFAVFGEVRYC